MRILDSHQDGRNEWSTPAGNPFEQGSTMHGNLDGQPVIFSWLVEGFPNSDTVVFTGDVILGDDRWEGEFFFTIEVEQSGWVKASKSYRISRRHDNRYGVSFFHDGSPYLIRYTLNLLTPERFDGAACGVLPIECTAPLAPARNPHFYAFEERHKHAVITVNQGGLINRIVCMLSCLRLAQRSNRDLRVWWGRNAHCAAALDELFICHRSDPSIYLSKFDRCINEDDAMMSDMEKRSGNLMVDTVVPFRESAKLDYGNIGALFKQLNLSRSVELLLSDHADVDFSNTAGVHLRRPFPSGAFAELERSKFNLPPELFEEMIASLLDEGFDRVFLCTNSEAEETRLRQRFGERLCLSRKTSMDNSHNPRAVQEALVDFILLSRCPAILCQSTSIFGFMAHAVGKRGCIAMLPTSTRDEVTFQRFRRGVAIGSPSVCSPDIAAFALRREMDLAIASTAKAANITL